MFLRNQDPTYFFFQTFVSISTIGLYDLSFLSICLYCTNVSLGLYDTDVSLGLYDADLSEGLYDAGSNNFDIGVFWQNWRDNYDDVF